MTCRVARSFHNSVSSDFVSCCECGSTHREVSLASTTLGPYLCQICARSIVGFTGEGTHDGYDENGRVQGGSSSAHRSSETRTLVAGRAAIQRARERL